MDHLTILPVLLPMFAGALLLLLPGERVSGKRWLSLLATLAQIPLALLLMARAEQGIAVYSLGNWMPPFGIVLVLDRLSALLLMVTAVLASCVVFYAQRGDDRLGRNFHALLQFQLMGINGAFLTGDLFNLFVFFEILLIASYALLLHGAGPARVRAGIHYVLLNLFGSALFLIAVGSLYGLLGTLNMADLALRVAALPAADAPLVGAAGLLLLVVFGLKAAVFPLYFWLPRAYASASAPVAALFAIMTKVGIYSILRVYTLIFAADAGPLAQLAGAWLWPLALVTLALGAVGVLAAGTLQRLVAYLVVISAGTLLAGIALGINQGSAQALLATLYYLVHSTWISAGLFLLAGVIGNARGTLAARLLPGPAMPRPLLLGGLFFVAAIGIVGMPPLSGFIGKLLLLQAAGAGWSAFWLYLVVLGGGLIALIGLSRAGSTLFWRNNGRVESAQPLDNGRLLAVGLLVTGSPLLVLLASPLLDYMQQAVAQLLAPAGYIEAVMSAGGRGQ